MDFQLASGTEDTIFDRLATEANDYRAFSRLSLFVFSRADAITHRDCTRVVFHQCPLGPSSGLSMISWFVNSSDISGIPGNGG